MPERRSWQPFLCPGTHPSFFPRSKAGADEGDGRGNIYWPRCPARRRGKDHRPVSRRGVDGLLRDGVMRGLLYEDHETDNFSMEKREGEQAPATRRWGQ